MKNTKSIKTFLAIAAFCGMSFIQTMNTFAREVDWGPKDRPTYTWDAPAAKATFNSITNNPEIGDERFFTRIKEYNKTGPHLLSVDVEPGKEYEVYVYYHNNASSMYNTDAFGRIGFAHNVRIASSMPTVLYDNQVGQVKAEISFTPSDTEKVTVWSSAHMYAHSTVYFKYVANSATLHNGSRGDLSSNGQVLDASALFSANGAKIAYWNDLWGLIPGCNEYAGYITYRVKAVAATGEVDKTVSEDGVNFKNEVSVNSDKTLDFKVVYKNTSELTENEIILKDTMPDKLEYIKGSTYVNGVQKDDSMFGNGLNIGELKAGETVTVTYKAKIANLEKFDCGETTVNNDVSVSYKVKASPKDDVFTVKDKIAVKIRKNCDGSTTTLEKTVSLTDKAKYNKSVNVNPGETVDFRVVYTNDGNVDQRDVVFTDKMPEGIEYVNGSTRYVNSADGKENVVDDSLFGNGLNLGTLKPGEKITIYYKGKVVDAEKVNCGESSFENGVKVTSVATVNGKEQKDDKSDKAKVTTSKVCEEPDEPEKPEEPEKEIPKEIVKTGPAEVAFAILVVLGIGVGGWYYWKSNKDLKMISNKVNNKKK